MRDSWEGAGRGSYNMVRWECIPYKLPASVNRFPGRTMPGRRAHPPPNPRKTRPGRTGQEGLKSGNLGFTTGLLRYYPDVTTVPISHLILVH